MMILVLNLILGLGLDLGLALSVAEGSSYPVRMLRRHRCHAQQDRHHGHELPV